MIDTKNPYIIKIWRDSNGRSKKFDKAFKEQAVERILAGETTRSKIAKELGLHYSTVRDWVIAFEKDGTSTFPGSGNLKPEDDELRR